MQLGWWHVLWPDHLPHTFPLSTRPEGLSPTCTSVAKQLPLFPSQLGAQWVGPNRRLPGGWVLRADSCGAFKRLRSRAQESLGFGVTH